MDSRIRSLTLGSAKDDAMTLDTQWYKQSTASPEDQTGYCLLHTAVHSANLYPDLLSVLLIKMTNVSFSSTDLWWIVF